MTKPPPVCLTKCRRFEAGKPFVLGKHCWSCFKEFGPNRVRLAPDVMVRKSSVSIPPCSLRGKPTGETKQCDSCAGKVELKLFACEKFGVCTIKKPVDGVACCEGCTSRIDPSLVIPVSTTRIDPAPLVPGPANAHFNSSIIRFKGRLLLAYRTGWAGANIHIAELDEHLKPGKSVTLHHLRHPNANFGREDPRLFIFQGRLHVSFVGVQSAGKGVVTNVLYARLTDNLHVDEVFAPYYFGRREWEKSWAFFEWENELFSVYSISPHVILHIRGNVAYPFSETKTEFPWSGGTQRGGASPLRIGDTFYHWFHGRIGRWGNGIYTMGVYTFSAKPPFRVELMTPEPILKGDLSKREADQTWEPAVVFPCGAILEKREWTISMGINDRHTDIVRYRAEEIDKLLGITPAPIEGNVVLSSAFLHCGESFGVIPSGRTDRVPLKSLNDAEMLSFFRTLIHTAETWKVQVVLLHDGLPPSVIDGLQAKGVRCEKVVPDQKYGPYEARWFAWRDFLKEHRHLNQVWFIDAGDVVFTCHPFERYEKLWLAVGRDEVSFGSCPWQQGQLKYLPTWENRILYDFPNDLPPNAGCWLTTRDRARLIVAETCTRIEEAYEELTDRPPPVPVVVDMAAFAMTILTHWPMCQDFPRKGGDPLFHDRVLCDAYLSQQLPQLSPAIIP